jgi:hypothetical protein
MNKDNQLEQQLDQLGERIASQPSILDAVMQRVETMEAPSRPAHRLGRIVMKSAMALAASVLVGIAVWLGIVGGPAGKAYGIQDMSERLQTARSMYLKGWQYHESADSDGNKKIDKVPVERYIGLPCRFYTCWSFTNNGVLGTGYEAQDTERYIRVDHAKKTCYIGRNYPFATELFVVGALELMPRTLMSGDPASYQKIRQEKIDGVLTDVYEASAPSGHGGRSRSVVWLNPRTGLPVRIGGYHQHQGQPERPSAEFHLVEVDTPPPAELFTFEPPAGYKVIQKDRGPESVTNGSGGAVNSVRFEFRFEFNISDRAILACWAWYDTAKKPYFEPDPACPPGQAQRMTLSGIPNDRKFRLVALRDDPGSEFRWHWSLIVPEDGKPLGQDQPSFTFTDRGSTSGHTASAWQRISRQTLADFVLKAQRITLPPDAPADAALTLEQIEAKIGELTRQP